MRDRSQRPTIPRGVLSVDGLALATLAKELAEAADHTEDQLVVAQPVRNRFSGLITHIVRDTVMAQVEIQAGPHRFVSLLSREATDELGLEPGMLVIAAIKATNVSVELPSLDRQDRKSHQTADGGHQRALCPCH